MMVLKADQERVKTLLRDTITLLCKNGLSFNTKFCIEAVIGVTLDDEDVFLLSMNEIINSDKPKPPQVSDEDSLSSSDERRRKRKRKRPYVKEEVNAQSAEEILASSDEEDQTPDSPSAGDVQFETSQPQEGSHFGQGLHTSQGSEFNGRTPVRGGAVDSKSSIQIKEEVDDSVWAGEDGPNQSLGVSMSDYPMETGYLPQDQSQTMVPDSMLPGVSQTQWMSPSMARGPRTSTVTSGADLSQSFDVNDSMNTSLGGSQQAPVEAGLPKTHQCMTCMKTFVNRWNLRVHEKRHNGEYLHHCDQCGKGFYTRSNLRAHMSHHTGIKEFHCEICNTGFRHKKNWKQHMTLKHNMAVP